MFTLLTGDCLETLTTLPDNSIDSVITDPPYGIEFMGKEWDRYTPVAFQDWFTLVSVELMRVLKPGGHAAVFGGTRMYHRMVCGLEDAGFEIRDSIHWTYGSGFPKSLNVGKAIDKAAGAERETLQVNRFGGRDSSAVTTGASNGGVNGGFNHKDNRDVTVPATPDAATWDGWGTALKPSHEPIVIARKPLVGTVAQNVLKYGTGAINIDATRVGNETRHNPARGVVDGSHAIGGGWHSKETTTASGRWGANTILTHTANCIQVGEDTSPVYNCVPGCPVPIMDTQSGHTDAGGASRYFTQTVWNPTWDVPFLYQPKASRRERNAGLNEQPRQVASGVYTGRMNGSLGAKTQPRQNIHPTVKPVALMRHLVRLLTPPGGTVLDPFLGSGTTAVAAILEGMSCVGCEKTDEYVPIIEGRVAHAEIVYNGNTANTVDTVNSVDTTDDVNETTTTLF